MDKCEPVDVYDKKRENIKNDIECVVTKNDENITLSDDIIKNEENTHKNLLHNNLNPKDVINNNIEKEEVLYDDIYKNK